LISVKSPRALLAFCPDRHNYDHHDIYPYPDHADALLSVTPLCPSYPGGSPYARRVDHTSGHGDDARLLDHRGGAVVWSGPAMGFSNVYALHLVYRFPPRDGDLGHRDDVSRDDHLLCGPVSGPFGDGRIICVVVLLAASSLCKIQSRLSEETTCYPIEELSLRSHNLPPYLESRPQLSQRPVLRLLARLVIRREKCLWVIATVPK